MKRLDVDDILKDLEKPLEELEKETWVSEWEATEIFAGTESNTISILESINDDVTKIIKNKHPSQVDKLFNWTSPNLVYLDEIVDSFAHSSIEEYKTLASYIKASNDINALDHLQNTLLHYFICSSEFHTSQTMNNEILEKMLMTWANPNLPDTNGNTALHLAIMSKNNSSTIELLIKYLADLNIKNDNLDSSFHLAVRNSYTTNFLITLLQSWADPFVRWRDGTTPFWLIQSMHAVHRDKLMAEIKKTRFFKQAREVLLDNLKSIKSNTDIDIIRSRDVDITDPVFNNMMKTAIDSGNNDLLSALIWFPINELAYNSDKIPIQECAKSWNKLWVNLLLQAWAQVLSSENWISAIDVANKSWRKDISAFIKYKSLKPETIKAIHKAWLSDALDLIEHNEDIDAKDSRGETLLFKALRREDPKILKIVLDAGCDANIKNSEWNTPLMFAVSTITDFPELVIILMDYGADSSIEYLLPDDSSDLHESKPKYISILDLAKKHCNYNAAQSLKSHQNYKPKWILEKTQKILWFKL